MSEPYTPTTEQVCARYVHALANDPAIPDDAIAADEFDRWLLQERTTWARDVLTGLSAWIAELTIKHPDRMPHGPLMQGHIARYMDDHYGEDKTDA